MAFADYQRERTRERAGTKEKASVFSARDIPLAVCRLGGDNPTIRRIAEQIKVKGLESVFPDDIIAENGHGRVFLDLGVLTQPEKLAKLRKIPGAIEFLEMLDKDLLLSGGESTAIAEFRKNREVISREVAGEMISGLRSDTDFDYELVGEATEHTFDSEEEKQAYETLQTKIQEIVDKLFAVSGLTNFKPKAYLTRSKEQNAWIFNVGNKEAAREYLDLAKKSPTPIELPIFVHFGMFKLAATDDELAGVLAHEFNHLLQPGYLGIEDKETIQRLEYDADASGARLADAAGYNPRGLTKLFGKFPESNNPLPQFGWGTHPDTARRITELEKEFNRAELPLPNGAKEFVAFSPAVAEAVKTIDESKAKKPRLTSYQGRAYTKSEEIRKEYSAPGYLEEHREPEFLLSPEIQSLYAKDADRKVRRVVIEQELAHGAVGYREELLDKLEDFLLILKEIPKDPNVKKTFLSCPTYFARDPGGIRMVGSLPETVLSAPRDDHYLGPKREVKSDYDLEQKRSSRQWNKELLLKNVSDEVKGSYGAGWRTKTIEDWIDPNNPDTVLFWDEVARAYLEDVNRNNVPVPSSLSREERLYYIYHLLGDLVEKPRPTTSYDRGYFISAKQEI